LWRTLAWPLFFATLGLLAWFVRALGLAVSDAGLLVFLSTILSAGKGGLVNQLEGQFKNRLRGQGNAAS
jgi:hypothetical protein